MDEQRTKKSAPVWPIIVLLLILLICIPLSIPLGMGVSVGGWNSISFILTVIIIGVPIAVFGMALYIYIRKIISENLFISKFYLIISIFLFISPLIFALIIPRTTRLIKRILFYLSFSTQNAIIAYILVPFLLFVILAYGIACIFDSKKRISGIIITLIILGILIFAVLDQKRESAQYNCFYEQACFVNVVIEKNDITRCDSIMCIYKFVDAKQLKPRDCAVLNGDLYDACIYESGIINKEKSTCFTITDTLPKLRCLEASNDLKLEDCSFLKNRLDIVLYDRCVYRFAILNKDKNSCLIISSEHEKFDCLVEIGRLTPEDCSIFSNYQNDCVDKFKN